MEEKKCEFKTKGSQYINGEYLCFASTNSKKTCLNKLCKDNPNCYYKRLQLKDKMIELLCRDYEAMEGRTTKDIINDVKQQALAELEE